MKKILFSITILGILFIASSCGCHNNETSSSINSISSNVISSNENSSLSNNSTTEDKSDVPQDSYSSINTLSIKME